MKKVLFLNVFIIALVAAILGSCSKEDDYTSNEQQNDEQDAGKNLKAATIEELCSNYFTDSEEEQKMAKMLIDRTNDFFDINGGVKEFEGKKTCFIQPVYAHGINGVAYYEIWLTDDNITPKGWIMFSATDKDYPIVNFSHNGTPFTFNLKTDFSLKGSKKAEDKIYRFGSSYFARENAAGSLIAENGFMPKEILIDSDLFLEDNADSENGNNKAEKSVNLVKDVNYATIDTYSELKDKFAKYYYSDGRADAAKKMRKTLKSSKSTNAEFIYRWASGGRARYTQIGANSGYNNTNCASGCTPTAWANMYAWWDINKGKGNLIPTTTTGETCARDRNTSARRDVVDPVQMYLNNVCGTYCASNGGATSWANIYKGYKYAPHKGYGYSYSYVYHLVSASDRSVKIANKITEAIANNYEPAHISISGHSLMGYGWAQWSTDTQRTWVYCYPGWRTDDSQNYWIHWRDVVSVVRLKVN